MSEITGHNKSASIPKTKLASPIVKSERPHSHEVRANDEDISHASQQPINSGQQANWTYIVSARA